MIIPGVGDYGVGAIDEVRSWSLLITRKCKLTLRQIKLKLTVGIKSNVSVIALLCNNVVMLTVESHDDTKLNGT